MLGVINAHEIEPVEIVHDETLCIVPPRLQSSANEIRRPLNGRLKPVIWATPLMGRSDSRSDGFKPVAV
jgi:hypothetical protein